MWPCPNTPHNVDIISKIWSPMHRWRYSNKRPHSTRWRYGSMLCV
jgi:hypothetical protein